MRTIWKYVIPLQNEVAVDLPRGAKILCVQSQRGIPCIWALVDPEAPTERVLFCWRGTGHPASGADVMESARSCAAATPIVGFRWSPVVWSGL